MSKSLNVSGNDDVMIGEEGRSLFAANGGHDVLVGAAGLNQAEFSGRLSDYDVIAENGTIRITDRVQDRDGSVTLVNFRPSDLIIFRGDWQWMAVGSTASDFISYDVSIGTGGPDRLSGRSGNDFAMLGDGDDIAFYTGGHDVVRGAGGTDILVLPRAANAYGVEELASGYEIRGIEGSLFVEGVELLIFSDKVTALDKPAALFDTDYYLAANPDVAAAVRRGDISAADHYRSMGWLEGRAPSPFFDGAAYLAANSDVAAAGLNPLDHYLMHGWAEGRIVTPTTAYWL